jgi:hypothetical protein
LEWTSRDNTRILSVSTSFFEPILIRDMLNMECHYTNFISWLKSCFETNSTEIGCISKAITRILSLRENHVWSPYSTPIGNKQNSSVCARHVSNPYSSHISNNSRANSHIFYLCVRRLSTDRL